MESQDPRITRTKRDITGAALEILLTQRWDAVTEVDLMVVPDDLRAELLAHGQATLLLGPILLNSPRLN